MAPGHACRNPHSKGSPDQICADLGTVVLRQIVQQALQLSTMLIELCLDSGVAMPVYPRRNCLR